MNLSSQLHQTALDNRDKAAFYFMDQHKTYAELDAAVTMFASGLTKLGIAKGDHIALITGNSPHFLIGFFGALRAGATVIPINPIYTADEISFILMNGDVKAVITLDVLAPLMEGIHKHLTTVEHYILCETGKAPEHFDASKLGIYPKLHGFDTVLGMGNLQFDEPELDLDDVAVILYTSGTTGKPKGAMLTHHNLYRNAKDVGDYLKINSDDRVITTLPMFHVFCLTVCMNAPLMSGGTIIIIPKFSPKEIYRVAKAYEATIFAGVPTMYNFLLQYNGDTDDFKSLRLCISGGASMPVALLKAFEQKFNVIISEGYGLSEASPVTCFNPLDRPRKAGSIGTSILNVKNKVVDEMGEELPVGAVGELVVQGSNVMKGYYKMPEETAAAIKDGWLYTGDLARMDEDGYLYIVDRKKDLIIVGGYNVYPREVEEVLFSHPGIVEAAVLGVPDPDQGEAVHAFIVRSDDSLTEQQVLAYCKEHLAKYKWPTMIEFLEELPKNTTGKILRRALKEIVTK
ncbi:fatty acid--CoA ligase family protein [Bacillus testis]|uniref:fatty acid--CoA ligase family protein n=1 Tax=Bacillus testis TaxID=1622072 RepID=UPI00067F29A2|nr:fatty acid--CoA ligase family protein [Bacillus testis]